jgi:hypothetical protein
MGRKKKEKHNTQQGPKLEEIKNSLDFLHLIFDRELSRADMISSCLSHREYLHRPFHRATGAMLHCSQL